MSAMEWIVGVAIPAVLALTGVAIAIEATRQPASAGMAGKLSRPVWYALTGLLTLSAVALVRVAFTDSAEAPAPAAAPSPAACPDSVAVGPPVDLVAGDGGRLGAVEPRHSGECDMSWAVFTPSGQSAGPAVTVNVVVRSSRSSTEVTADVTNRPLTSGAIADDGSCVTVAVRASRSGQTAAVTTNCVRVSG